MNKAIMKRLETVEQSAAAGIAHEPEMTDAQFYAALLDLGIEIDPAQRELARTATPYTYSAKPMTDEEFEARLKELGIEREGCTA